MQFAQIALQAMLLHVNRIARLLFSNRLIVYTSRQCHQRESMNACLEDAFCSTAERRCLSRQSASSVALVAGVVGRGDYQWHEFDAPPLTTQPPLRFRR